MSEFVGKVLKNSGRGEELGFRTANLEVDEHAEEGVFAGSVELEGKIYKAAVFIGKPETFGDNHKRLEVHILDFNKDIVGKVIKVTIFKKIRENKKFDSKEELNKQIKNDIKEIRNV